MNYEEACMAIRRLVWEVLEAGVLNTGEITEIVDEAIEEAE